MVLNELTYNMCPKWHPLQCPCSHMIVSWALDSSSALRTSWQAHWDHMITIYNLPWRLPQKVSREGDKLLPLSSLGLSEKAACLKDFYNSLICSTTAENSGNWSSHKWTSYAVSQHCLFIVWLARTANKCPFKLQ